MRTDLIAPSAAAPRRDAFRRFATWLASPAGLATLVTAGLVLRLVLARGSGGFPFDMPSFQAWAGRLADKGPLHFYPKPHESYFVDYPPGYLYVLWFLGLFAKAFGGGAIPVFFIKLPAIAGDLGLAWLVTVLAERLTPVAVTRRVPVRGLAAAAILLNPAFFFISATWGQVDVFLAIPIIAAFLLLGTGIPSFRREAGGMALLALAIGTKPQGAFVLPIVVLVLIWRHARKDAYVAHGAALQGFARVVTLGVVGIVSGLILFAPFRLGPIGALRFYAHSGGTYPVTSVFAFNFWGVFGFWKHDLPGLVKPDDVLKLFGIPALYFGLTFFAVAIVLVLLRAWRALRDGEDEGRVLVFGSLALSLVGYALLTRIHERYLFLPLALAAVFVGVRWMRRAFVALSALYFVNVYFPYVYYLRYEHRHAVTFGGLFDGIYGTDYNGLNMKVMSAIITAVTLLVAWQGWTRMRPAPDEIEDTEPVAEAPMAPPLAGPPDAEPPPKPKWALRLYPVRRRGVLMAVAIFLIAFISRVAMLGHPPGMYFDEVYHARTGAEYLGHKEVFEWTHPPLGKEFIGFSIQHLSNFGARGDSRLPKDARAIGSSDTGMLWATGGGRTFEIHSGELDTSCGLHEKGTPIRTTHQPFALTGASGAVYVATTDNTLVKYNGGTEEWSAALPAPAMDVALAGTRAYVLTEAHQLVGVSQTGVPNVVAVDATAISGASRDRLVWASFKKEKKVAAWDEQGSRHAVIAVSGRPTNIAAIDLADRVYVTVSNHLVSIESDDQKVETTMRGGAEALGQVPETGILWAASGSHLRAIEPHAAVTIGQVNLHQQTGFLLADPVNHQIVDVAGQDISCASGRPQFAWRLGSAIFGAAMVGMLVLLALLLFGSEVLALLAGLFLTIEGVAFTVSRIAMVDSYSIAFLLAAWFCALSALRASGASVDPPGSAGVAPAEGPPRRRAAIVWLAAGGVCGGISLASKWIGLYAIVGIGVVFVWDAFARGRESIWRVAGSAMVSTLLLALFFVVVPLAIYIAAYQPYFTLGHTFGDFLSLQKQMYDYHANLHATHPFSSPWWAWPFGTRAVFLYLLDQGPHRSEIWTFPNLVIYWGGLVGMFFAVREAIRKRAAAIAFIAVGAAFQYLPWVSISRVTFMYHYLATIPFLCLALAWYLVKGLEGNEHQREIAIGVTVAAVVFFLAVFPMLVGWSMPSGYLDGVRHLLPWVIR